MSKSRSARFHGGNTRLHLIAALAEEYGRTEEFVFVDAERRFVAVAPPRPCVGNWKIDGRFSARPIPVFG